jgi:lysophospholipase L1-like esterase
MPAGRADIQDWICSSPAPIQRFLPSDTLWPDATTKPIMVYVASDSTTCDQTGGAYGGWAQMLPEYLGPPVGIANYANSGAASGDFGFWGDISSRWTKGDWIIIQFGHNDKQIRTPLSRRTSRPM